MTPKLSDLLSALLPTGLVDADGLYATRRLADGRWLCVEPQTFQRARLAISHAAGATAREALNAGMGYADVWDYETREAAIVAMEMWDGTPTGWTRRASTRERRRADGSIVVDGSIAPRKP